MSKSFIGDPLLAEMTEGQTADSALDDAALKDEMDPVARESSAVNLSQSVATASSLSGSAPESGLNSSFATDETTGSSSPQTRGPHAGSEKPAHSVRQRFGLPQGFVPRWRRFERSILLEQNIYRLPNGCEFIPGHPKGTLGAHQHLYALLTTEQYQNNRRGSVYVRSDGRIFDYSLDGTIPGGDLFDTGYTIHDLERTGRYAPSLDSQKNQRRAKFRRAASAG